MAQSVMGRCCPAAGQSYKRAGTDKYLEKLKNSCKMGKSVVEWHVYFITLKCYSVNFCHGVGMEEII